jgi:hypothetical protein
MESQPILLSKQKAIALAGIGKNLFAEIEPQIPFVQIKKQKKYCLEDIKRVIENLKRSPCTPHQSKTKKIATSSIPRSQFLEWGGLEEAVKQTTGGMQTNTH